VEASGCAEGVSVARIRTLDPFPALPGDLGAGFVKSRQHLARGL
jgi:hypothetical protein